MTRYVFWAWLLAMPALAPEIQPTTQPSLPILEVTPATWPTTQVRGAYNVVFADGIYSTITIPAGASGSTFRAKHAWLTCVIGQVHGIDVQLNTRNVTIRGFRVAAPRGTGIKSAATSGITIEDCWVHSCGQSGISGFHHSLVVRRCLVEFCGLNPWHDHGIYIGSRPLCVIEDCIIRRNSGCGIGMAKGSLQATIRRNLIHDNGAAGLLFELVPISGGKPSEISSNTIIANRGADLDLQAPAQSTAACGLLTSNIVGKMNLALFPDGALRIVNTGNRIGYAPEGFVGYYKPSPAIDAGWPASNWPASTVGWDEGKIPYCPDPATGTGAPRSLFPASAN